MIANRLIPVLLLSDRGLCKTRAFRNPKYVGDPTNAVRIFNDKEVDELLILDIQASRQGRSPDFEVIARLAAECFMPLGYGGGVSNRGTAAQLFDRGVEKVIVNTACLEEQGVIQDIAVDWGTQAVIAAIDVLPTPDDLLVFDHRRGQATSLDVLDHVSRCVDAGAGEIMITDVRREGSLAGPNLDLVRRLANDLRIPLIYNGGVRHLVDARKVVEAGAHAVAGGAMFVYRGPHRAVLITYPPTARIEEAFGIDP